MSWLNWILAGCLTILALLMCLIAVAVFTLFGDDIAERLRGRVDTPTAIVVVVTATPEPTATMEPTATEEPTATATMEPSATDQSTVIVEATETPVPTSTVAPTATATATATPTATLAPTPTAVPTEIPIIEGVVPTEAEEVEVFQGVDPAYGYVNVGFGDVNYVWGFAPAEDSPSHDEGWSCGLAESPDWDFRNQYPGQPAQITLPVILAPGQSTEIQVCAANGSLADDWTLSVECNGVTHEVGQRPDDRQRRGGPEIYGFTLPAEAACGQETTLVFLSNSEGGEQAGIWGVWFDQRP